MIVTLFSYTVRAQVEFKLLPGDGQQDDAFGMVVGIDGDYAVVGAPYDDNDNGADAGAVYIFQHQGNNWIELMKLLASDGAAEDYFGYAVDIDGDHVVVGACWDDDAGEKSGSAYIFQRDGDSWTEEAKLTAADAGEDDRFGIDIAICGNDVIDGAYLVIGAYKDVDNGTNSGSIYIYHRDGTNWIEQKKIVANNGAENDLFGSSVAFDKDRVVVGAYGDDDLVNNAGSIFIGWKHTR